MGSSGAKKHTTMAVKIIVFSLMFIGKRVKSDVGFGQPSLVTRDGHLVLMASSDRNISLQTSGEGCVNLNGENLLLIAKMARNASEVVERLRTTQLASLELTVQGLSTAIDGRRGLKRRMASVELGLAINGTVAAAGGGGGGTRRTRMKQLIDQVAALTRRMTIAEQQVRELRTQLTTNECASNPCNNGGTCEDSFNTYICRCPDNWEGPTCSKDVNECLHFVGTDLGCQNGATCYNKPGSYDCVCSTGWHGVHCTVNTNDCSTGSSRDLCGHGICVNQPGPSGYTCICDLGWTVDPLTRACSVDKDECAGGRRPCSTNPLVACINTPGSFTCAGCPAGYTGDGFYCNDIDECQTNNGGCSSWVGCTNTVGSRVCSNCPGGFRGDGVTCVFVGGACSTNNGGCHPSARCQDNMAISSTYVMCTCPAGYVGNGMGPTGCAPGGGDVIVNSCQSNPCRRGGSCVPSGSSFRCVCPVGYTGTDCNFEINGCSVAPCMNGGTCTRLVDGGFFCTCAAGFFGLRCSSQSQACGGTRLGDSGTIKFPEPNTRTSLGNSLSCAWMIQVNSSLVVNVTFKSFKLHATEEGSCLYDWLQIHDGRSSGELQLGKYCGLSLPNNGNIVSTTNTLYLWFRADQAIGQDGFELQWNASAPVCGGTINATSHGTISSPGSPGKYPPNRDCLWNIVAPSGKRIQFQFFTLQIEAHPNCGADYLAIYDGARTSDSLLKMFCNTSSPSEVVSSANAALLKFHSDGAGSDNGFQIVYTVIAGIPGCGVSLTAPEGEISSSLSPDEIKYRNNLNCAWVIRLPINERIKITFTKFDLEQSRACLFDFVEIRDGEDENAPLVGKYCGRTLPRDYNTLSNVLYIRFHTDFSGAYGGFLMKYMSICGGDFGGENGIITSPNYPNSYPNSRTCVYRISQPQGKAIKLHFLDFEVEATSYPECNFDYLQVRDGINENSTLLGKYCGGPDKTPGDIISTHNIMWMEFKTDYSTRNRGFNANYSTIDTQCGGILREQYGFFGSPSHLEKYPHNTVCSWVIIADPGRVIQLTFNTFALESHSSCLRDYVAVYDNTSLPNTGGLLGRFCGGTKPPVFTSTETMMTIQFVTDHSISMDGFTATYVTMDASKHCGGFLVSTIGVIKSPNYPKDYLHDKDCTWVINVPQGQQIMLNVTLFQIEKHSDCVFDFLEIRNGGSETSPLIGKFCGKEIPPLIYSHGNQMYVHFVTDQSRSDKGFYMTWDGTATGCGGTLTAPKGSIASPNYPSKYHHNAECTWKIAASQGSKIQLNFVDLELEPNSKCRLDYLEVYNGLDASGKSVGKYCSSHPSSIVSTNNHLFLKFRSDMSQAGRGFHLTYQTMCDTSVTGFMGVIESPNFPDNYPGNLDCTWTINATKGNKVNITFSHFNTEIDEDQNIITNLSNTTGSRIDVCAYDYLQVTESDSDMPNPSDNVLGNFCGSELPPPVYSSKNHVFLHFVSDRHVADMGFRLEWVVNGCGGYLVKSHGSFSTPNYPLAHPNSLSCEWIIETSFGNSIELNISQLSLERGRGIECVFDSVSVYNGNDDTSERLAQYCMASGTNLVTTTSGKFMFVRFVSDHSFTGKGFTATYRTVNTTCGGKMTGPRGSFHSLNYPNNYNSNDDCFWMIEVKPTHLITLAILDFDVEKHGTCVADYFKLYDGNSTDAALLLTHCNNELPSPSTFTSTSNQLLVHFHTDSSLTAKGFLANYSIACGAKIVTASTGLISLVDDINSGGANGNCSWIIVGAKPDDRVSMTVTHLDISSNTDNDNDNDCRYYYAEFLDGQTLDSPPINGQYCGSKAPPTLVSSGNAMVVHLVALHGVHYGNFEASYSVISGACGGNLTSEAGSFASPDYPNNYPIDVECVWTINASPGNRAQLSFSYLHLGETDSCNDNYVEIREVDSLGKMIGVYCNGLPGNVTASKSLWIKFRSGPAAEATANRGFVASYTLVHGNELTGESGQIASPLYPRSYVQTGEFNWRITVTYGNAVAITFKDFSMDEMSGIGSNNCPFYVAIYDGFDETAPELLKTCGIAIPAPITSSSNVVYLKMATDPMRSGTLFLLDWLQVPKSNARGPLATIKFGPKVNVTGCGGTIQMQHQNGTPGVYPLTSPGYPGGYAGRLDCKWIVETIPGYHVALGVSVMDLETSPSCKFDNLQVYFGQQNTQDWQLETTLCHSNSSDAGLIHSSSLMQLIFHTDPVTNKTGFSATLYSLCGGTLTQPNGIISSSNASMGNRYFVECQWNITMKPGKRIAIKFTNIGIPQAEGNLGCGNEYIMLKNGGSMDSPLLGSGKYCGTTVPSELETVGNRAFIYYRASRISAANFRLQFREVSIACGGNILLTATMNSTNISSPNYPNVYPPFTECIWTFMAPAGEMMQMDFLERLDLKTTRDCSIEAVEVRDGGTQNSRLIGRYCFRMPSTLESTGNILHVRFFTNNDNPKNGFKANISIGRCGGTIRAMQGMISSPNYPNQYPPNTDCQWRIVTYSGHALNINIPRFDLNFKANCTTADFVSITEVGLGNDTDNFLGTFCTGNLAIRTPGNEAIVKFHSGASSSRMRTYAGFRLSFNASASECGGILETPTGVIQSLGYPMYLSKRNCQWRITVPKGRRVTLKLLDFVIAPSSHSISPMASMLNVYNDHKYKSLIASYNSSSVPNSVSSTSNLMMVSFWSHVYSSNYRGFKATYSSDEPAVCGGNLENDTSPGYITAPRNISAFSCEWGYTRPAEMVQTFTMTVLNGTVGKINFYSRCEYSESQLKVTSQDDSTILSTICGDVTSPLIISSPYPGTKIKATAGIHHGNVDFTIKYSTSSCGGLLSGPEETISSPGLGNYPADTNCAWAVTYPSNQAIRVNFTKFDVEQSTNCSHDYLLIRNGLLPDSPLIGRFCGTTIPNSIQSQSNGLWIEFHSDSANQRPGFSLTLQPVVSGCGGRYDTNTGELFSPNFPDKYPSNAECDWELRSHDGFTIQLTFIQRFFIEVSPNCVKDFIEVFDFVGDAWKSLGKVCGRIAPHSFNATGNRMRVLFRSDGDDNADGFKAQWSVNCGGIIEQKKGRIVSPGYPQFYVGNLFCNYTILAPNKYISTNFETFALEKSSRGCVYDNLTMYGIPNAWTKSMVSLGTYCGTDKPPPRVFKDKLAMVLQSDPYLEAPGFLMTFEVFSCGGELTSSSTIQSPSETMGFTGNVNCTWTITAPSNQVIILKFSQLELEHSYGCHYDSVAVYEGRWINDTSLMGKYCGNQTSEPPLVKSKTNQIVVSIRMHHNRPKYVVLANVGFTYGEKVGCGGQRNVTSTNTIMRTPDINADGKYEDYLDCQWLLIAPEGSSIKFTFNELIFAPCFNTTFNASKECTCDYVEIRDGSDQFADLIGRYCSSRPSVPFVSSSNNLWVRFVSDDYGNGRGFQATVSSIPSVCGNVQLNVTETPQVLTSPGYPGNYPNNLRCRWLLWSTKQMRFDIHFEQVDIEQSDNCASDNLVITDTGTSKVITQGLGRGQVTFGRLGNSVISIYRGSRSPMSPITICGQPKLLDYYSESNNVAITFVTNQEAAFKGFKIIYNLAGCTRNYTGEQGRIVVDNVPSRCIITITAAPNHTISAYFNSFHLIGESDCSNKALAIRDGPDENFPKLAQVCGYVIPSPVFSTASQMYLHSWNRDSSSVAEHFDITYTTTDKGRGCGGQIFNYGGTFTSPFYPNNYRSQGVCRWDVSVPTGLVAVIKFSVFDLGPKNTCDTDFVELIDVDTDTQVEYVRVRYCGEDNPATFRGEKGTVAVRYTTSQNNGGTGWVIKFISLPPGTVMP